MILQFRGQCTPWKAQYEYEDRMLPRAGYYGILALYLCVLAYRKSCSAVERILTSSWSMNLISFFCIHYTFSSHVWRHNERPSTCGQRDR